jgi:Ca-activated chloride channel family protein
MTFANPYMLFLLALLPPALIAFFWWSGRKQRSLVVQFIQSRLLPGLTVGFSLRRRRIMKGCLVLSVACLILALARPQWGFDLEQTRQRGLDIVVAIDTSKSMLAEDIAPNRLARAKLAALDLMQQARSDRLGLVAFAGSAFLQCPLTVDDTAFRQSVASLDVDTIPQGGTALAEAIETAAAAFKEEDHHRALVLFTDGEDHEPGAIEAAQKAAEAGLHMFTIGIGSAEGELLRLKDSKGRSDYIKDDQGNVVKSRLNEKLLQEIAGAGAAPSFYLPLRGAKVIDTLYQQGLAPLPKSDAATREIRLYHERYHWPLAVAILLLAAEMIMPERARSRSRSQSGGSSSGERARQFRNRREEERERERRPILSEPAVPFQSGFLTFNQQPATFNRIPLLLALLILPLNAHASTSSALREYNDGKFDLALKDYMRLLEKKDTDPRLHFNAGAAAYRSHQFEDAAKLFNESLSSPDLKLQALSYYNRGNSFFRIGEALPDPQKKIETWEKSLKDYQSVMHLNSADADAKFNYDFVKKKLDELKQQQQKQNQQNNIQPSEDAKRAKAEADAAVARREYAKALEIMETQLNKDPSTQYYSDYIQRLKEVNGVQDSAKH